MQNSGWTSLLRGAVFGVQARSEEGRGIKAENHEEDRQEKKVSTLSPELLTLARATKGFMPEAEGDALMRAASTVAAHGPLLEVGAYCGRSAIYLGTAARQAHSVLFSVDHHRGSEENQAGWEWHDAELVDPLTGRMDTLPWLRRTIEAAGLDHHVVAVVGESSTVAQYWSTPLALCFIDGGHGRDIAHADYGGWARHIAPQGLLAIHDVFPCPADGGRPPYEIYLRALGDGFQPETTLSTGSLRILRRLIPTPNW